jgi:hypothetical protein
MGFAFGYKKFLPNLKKVAMGELSDRIFLLF